MKKLNMLINSIAYKFNKAYSINFGPQHPSAHSVTPDHIGFPIFKAHNIMHKFCAIIFGPEFNNFTEVLNYKMECWREEIDVLRNFSLSHTLVSYLITAVIGAVFYYFFLMLFGLSNIVLGETLLAYFVNNSCFGVLGTEIFSAIEAERIARFEELLNVVKLPALQYDPTVSKEQFFIFISNQMQLMQFAMCYLSLFGLARLNLEVTCLPFVAPILDSIGFFDNSAKSEYGNLPYSAFIQKGLIDLCIVFYTSGAVELSPQDRKLTFLFLDYLTNFCMSYA